MSAVSELWFPHHVWDPKTTQATEDFAAARIRKGETVESSESGSRLIRLVCAYTAFYFSLAGCRLGLAPDAPTGCPPALGSFASTGWWLHRKTGLQVLTLNWILVSLLSVILAGQGGDDRVILAGGTSSMYLHWLHLAILSRFMQYMQKLEAVFRNLYWIQSEDWEEHLSLLLCSQVPQTSWACHVSGFVGVLCMCPFTSQLVPIPSALPVLQLVEQVSQDLV